MLNINGVHRIKSRKSKKEFFIILCISGILLAIISIFAILFCEYKIAVLAGVFCALIFVFSICFYAFLSWWEIDETKIVVRNKFGIINQIKFNDIHHIEERFLWEASARDKERIIAYVFISKTKKEKDNEIFDNRNDVAVRIAKTDIVDKLLALYYVGDILDKKH